MSEVLARIRVRETAGIRRFLYPSQVTLELPAKTEAQFLQLTKSDGQPIPTEFRLATDFRAAKGHNHFHFRFAVFLSPFEELELRMQIHSPISQVLDDPLNIHHTEDGFDSRQKRFFAALSNSGAISRVVYDGMPHLRAADTITLNNIVTPESEPIHCDSTFLALEYMTSGQYSKEATYGTPRNFLSVTSLTACKSWIQRIHWVEALSPRDEIVFTLPFAVTSPTLTCDFGVGGYVFGKLDDEATEIVWHTEFGDGPYAKWTVATAGRVDYVGEVATANEFRSQQWFHLIDSDKALAVAITRLPDACREMTVQMTRKGDVSVAFKMGETGPAEFGVCYHFLNDVPAIAAATSPQSILLPPVVEVLPLE